MRTGYVMSMTAKLQMSARPATRAFWLLALVLLLSAGCSRGGRGGGSGSGAGNCDEAMSNAYAQGCVFYSSTGSMTESQAITACQGYETPAEETGCTGELGAWTTCLAQITGGNCGGCDGQFQDFISCADNIDYCADYSGTDPCCDTADSCDLAGNDYCDCSGGCAWEEDECACLVCIDEHCSTQEEACALSADCVNLIDCIIECGDDDACVEGCASTYSAGVDPLIALLDCRDERCSIQCGG